MNKITTVLAAAISALLMFGLASPASADTTGRIYDPVTNTWKNADGTPFLRVRPGATMTPRGTARAMGSPIPREMVAYDGKYKPGTIVVETEQHRLFYVLGGGQAVSYGIGVGRDGFRWAGQHTITRKAEWPGWTPPAEMRKRVPDLPAYMPGGPDNPLGARALYIGATLYRLHGTSEPWTIGQNVSSGCIRLTNDDIIDLYSRVKVGSMVVVHQ